MPPEASTAVEIDPSGLVCVKAPRSTNDSLPAGSTIRTRSLCAGSATTSTLKPPLESMSTGVIAPVVVLTIVTVSRGLAVPCVARTVTLPPTGMPAVIVPAAGTGGGAVSSDSNVDWNTDASG